MHHAAHRSDFELLQLQSDEKGTGNHLPGLSFVWQLVELCEDVTVREVSHQLAFSIFIVSPF